MKKYIFGKNLRYMEYSSINRGYCEYSVYGEDSNCDLGGYHRNPFLGNVEGDFKDVLEYAANKMNGFYQWGGGSGGYIVPLSSSSEVTTEVTIIDKKKKLQRDRKVKLNKLVSADIDYLIDNIDNLGKDELKEFLIRIRGKV